MHCTQCTLVRFDVFRRHIRDWRCWWSTAALCAKCGIAMLKIIVIVIICTRATMASEFAKFRIFIEDAYRRQNTETTATKTDSRKKKMVHSLLKFIIFGTAHIFVSSLTIACVFVIIAICCMPFTPCHLASFDDARRTIPRSRTEKNSKIVW